MNSISYIDIFSVIFSCLVFGSFLIILFFDWMQRGAKTEGKKASSHIWHIPVLLTITFASGLALFIGYTYLQIIGIIPLSPYLWDVGLLLSLICIITFGITHLVWLILQNRSFK